VRARFSRASRSGPAGNWLACFLSLAACSPFVLRGNGHPPLTLCRTCWAHESARRRFKGPPALKWPGDGRVSVRSSPDELRPQSKRSGAAFKESDAPPRGCPDLVFDFPKMLQINTLNTIETASRSKRSRTMMSSLLLFNRGISPTFLSKPLASTHAAASAPGHWQTGKTRRPLEETAGLIRRSHHFNG
jgi:hypothetical protein